MAAEGERRSGEVSASAARRALPFQPPLLLAPMEGLSTPPFRALLADKGGLGAVFTEFISETASTSRRVARRTMVGGPVPLVVQLLGRDPERLARSTALLVEAGARGVDLNVGCPSRTVTRRGRGAALLREPERLSSLLVAMVGAAGAVPVSAKVRAGWRDASRLRDIARLVEDAGCAYLTVHARTFTEGYEGEASLELVERARAAVRIPVVANGDVRAAAEALRILREGVADGVMIGRGAVRNPWIFAQAAALTRGVAPPAPSGAELAGFLRELAARYLAAFGEGRRRAVLSKLKEVASYLSPAVLDGGAFWASARRAVDLEGFEAAVRELLEPLAGEQLAVDPWG